VVAVVVAVAVAHARFRLLDLQEIAGQVLAVLLVETAFHIRLLDAGLQTVLGHFAQLRVHPAREQERSAELAVL
jgi:hypothetical protein